MNKLGIYIHWPFCLSKCPYCDFFSEVKNCNQDALIGEYLDDLDFYYDLSSDKKVESIFFGGGTPSLIEPASIEKIINHITKKWQVASDVEISLEANPNTNKPSLFKDLKGAGINRLSLGVQSLNDVDLRFLGRSHDRSQALQAINDVLKNFDNHNIDLIYGRPQQKILNWEKELNEASGFGFEHLSLYQLSIEDGTAFYRQGIEQMLEDEALEMSRFTEAFLRDKEYLKYEVSNFAKAGFECGHNLGYWQGEDYVGVGKGAHGRLNGFATTHRRVLEKLEPMDRAKELLLMGLRIAEGIDKERFKLQCGLEFYKVFNAQKMVAEGLLIDGANKVRVTPKGMELLDYVVKKLVC